MRALMLAIIAATLPALAPLAAAQDPTLPVGLDLNGTWELEERGELLSSDKAIVKITHTAAGLVKADFLSGAECFNGQARPYAFIGQLSFKVPGEPSISSPTMYVCSGSPSEVKRCGGSIPAMYVSKFTDAVVTPDLNTGWAPYIVGKRFAQGYEGCQPNSKYDGLHTFILMRVSCPLENRKVREKEQGLRDAVSAVLASRTIFNDAIAAARARYGERFNGQPLIYLDYPSDLVDLTWESELATTEVFALELPRLVTSDEWKRARDMAVEMSLLGNNPVLEVRAMLERMYEIEDRLAPRVRQAMDDLRNARAEQAKCLR